MSQNKKLPPIKTNILVRDVCKAKIALYPMKEVLTTRLSVSVKAGSWYEKGNNWGAFHLLEHLCMSKTKKFSSGGEINRFCEENGISYFASCGGEELAFSFKAPYFSLEKMCTLFEQILFNPMFSTKDINKEIKIISHEYTNKWDNPQIRFQNKIKKALFGKNHIYTRNGIGQPEYLRKVSPQFLKEIHKKYFIPQNLSIAIAGKFDDTGNLIKTFDDILKNYKNKNVRPKTLEIPPIKLKNKSLRHHENVKSAYIHLIWDTLGRNNSSLLDKMKLKLLSHILGRGPSSILFKKLRQEHQLAYTISARAWFLPTCGFFEIGLKTDPHKISQAISIIKSTIKNFSKEKEVKENFRRSINYLNIKTYTSFDCVDDIADTLVNDLFLYRKIISPQEYIELSHKIKEEDLKSLALELSKKEPFIAIMSNN